MKYESFDRDKFHVVCMVSNPARFSSRYRLYRKFALQMQHAGVNFWTVEVQLGDRPFCITEVNNPKHLQLRHWDELWIKENAINLGIQKLPIDWETVAWIDADIEFLQKNWSGDDNHLNPFDEHHDWVTETLHQLQVHKIVQMWETAIDLGPNGETIAVHKSFMSQYIKNGARFPEGKGLGGTYYLEWHPGYAWAARREAFDEMGGLFPYAVMGSGDRNMCLAFVGEAAKSFHPDVTSSYKEAVMAFQNRCEHSIRRDVGYVKGTIVHNWHGRKKDRRYFDRWQVLIKYDFIPWKDVKPNSYGLFELNDDHSDRFVKLRDAIRAYHRMRNEDGTEL